MNLPPPGLLGSSEDHGFRSGFIQWLLHQPFPPPEQRRTYGDPIPKVLVQYWHDLQMLPSDVKECLDSWQPILDEGFSRLIFDDERARSFISEHYSSKHVEAFDLCYHPAMRCNYFRLCYVFKYGGFYVDADEVYRRTGCEALVSDDKLKVQPLCYDTATDAMVRPEDFLKDVAFPSNRIFYVNNNPLIAPAGHELLRMALERSTHILLRRSERPEIQSTTGPGNLSATLVDHAAKTRLACRDWDFAFLIDWEQTSVCRWALEYRNDQRNWRLLDRMRQ
jgi:hypothetical protein